MNITRPLCGAVAHDSFDALFIFCQFALNFETDVTYHLHLQLQAGLFIGGSAFAPIRPANTFHPTLSRKLDSSAKPAVQYHSLPPIA